MPPNINPDLEKLSVAIDELRPDAQNARLHDDRSVDAIAKSLAEFGQQKPIVVLTDGMVIAGNGTYLAAKKLGWDRLAVVRFESADKARAFALADNRTSELSGWNQEELLKQLESFDADKASLVGFTNDDIKDLMEHRRNPFVVTRMSVDDLKPHPRNYQQHPEDQLAHIVQSIKTNGFYRNVVLARDNTILAGHGVVEAAKKMGMGRVPVIKLDIAPDDPRALKVLTSDNEISNLAATDDRALTELLKDIMGAGGLLGTGFDEQQLATLAFVTRPKSEIADMNEASAWVGLPEYESGVVPLKLVITFKDEADRKRYVDEHGLRIDKFGETTWSTRWPFTEREDTGGIQFEANE